MKILITIFLLLSVNAFAAESYELRVAHGIQICNEDHSECAATGVAPYFVKILVEEGVGSHVLPEQTYGDFVLQRNVVVIKAEESCTLAMIIGWIDAVTGTELSLDMKVAKCSDVEGGDSFTLLGPKYIGKDLYIPEISIHPLKEITLQ